MNKPEDLKSAGPLLRGEKSTTQAEVGLKRESWRQPDYPTIPSSAGFEERVSR